MSSFNVRIRNYVFEEMYIGEITVNGNEYYFIDRIFVVLVSCGLKGFFFCLLFRYKVVDFLGVVFL